MRFIGLVRDADWLTADRSMAWSRVLLGTFVAVSALWLSLADGLVDYTGRPIGTDFIGFYAASKLALAGAPASVWDASAAWTAQTEIFGRSFGYWGFWYPPPFLLLCLPLALLSYGGALLAWLSLTSGAAIACLRRWSEGQVGWIGILSFPALWINAGHGQNGALTTALLATGFLVLPRHAVLAGFAFGGLVIKPQLGVALLFALLAARRWRPICAAGVTSIGLCLLATVIFGPDIWRGFLTSTSLARAALEQNVLVEKMPTIFAAARLYGAPLGFAYGAQAITALTALGFLVRCVRRHRPDALALGAITVAATVLVSPYLLDYDLSVIGLPLAWLSGRGLVHGFLPHEKFGILAAFALPLISRSISLYLHLAVGPIVLVTLMCLVARRISTEAEKARISPGVPVPPPPCGERFPVTEIA